MPQSAAFVEAEAEAVWDEGEVEEGGRRGVINKFLCFRVFPFLKVFLPAFLPLNKYKKIGAAGYRSLYHLNLGVHVSFCHSKIIT
jgi:hypothetical protein